MTDWEKLSKEMLGGYIKTLIDSMEKNLDAKTREKIFNDGGKFCAKHASELFKSVKESTSDLKEAVQKLNEKSPGVHYELLNNRTIKVQYDQCYCPMINLNLYKTPVQCECSKGWLKSNLEIIVGKPVKIELKQSVLRGGAKCELEAKF